MEAKHEGTVCSVDISTDGLKVVCGTLYGSLGILDKSNQKYRTLVRSHTDEILGMDFHSVKKNIITVSKDKTIRLWDVDTADQVYEFSSPIDQPLAVAAHPYLPLFSCGFNQVL
jgi:WD40 repeat protein